MGHEIRVRTRRNRLRTTDEEPVEQVHRVRDVPRAVSVDVTVLDGAGLDANLIPACLGRTRDKIKHLTQDHTQRQRR